nr:PREDICTED: polycystic kidney disease protein 1-like 2 [Lepisosteus oculatus]
MHAVALSVILFVLNLDVSQGGGLDSSNRLSCPEYQEGFDSSCYEFVSLQRSFLSAQGWCERGGGHLVFILNDETQQFLQKHLVPDRDWWIGLARATQNLTLETTFPEGPLSWLDGSDVSYANWEKEPQPGSHCGHILKDSGFQWEATSNCSRELHFVCEFEFGRSLACADHNATLQCGSGRVIEIDDSFYGRKTVHYCRLPTPLPTPSLQEECSWVDVLDLVAGHCHGLQVCQATADVTTFGEPCPGLGSYLSVEYHCREGLQLLVGDLAAVFENVTISMKWLLFPFSGNLSCCLSTGDGHTIDTYKPEKLESSVIHSYTHPGSYLITVECTTSEWHVTAQSSVTIQEPIGKIGGVRCYSMNQSGDATHCRALYGSELKIQVELEAGTNVTYRVQSEGALLATATVMRAVTPHNISIGSEAPQQLGPGSHWLTLLATNGVTASEVSMSLEVLFTEPLLGLQASIVSEKLLAQGSDLLVTASVSQGFPVQLHFKIAGTNESFSDSRQMDNDQHRVFNIPMRGEGTFRVVVIASNGFSEMDLDLGDITVISNTSEPHLDSNIKEKMDLNHDMTEEHSNTRVVRDNEKLYINLDNKMPVKMGTEITLEADKFKGNDNDYNFIWNCVGGCREVLKPCGEIMDTNSKEIQLPGDCYPVPFTVVVVSVTLKNKKDGSNQTAENCLAVTDNGRLNVKISCEENCDGVDSRKDVRLKLICSRCQEITWYYANPQKELDIPKDCGIKSSFSFDPINGAKENYLVVNSSSLEKAIGSITVRALGVSGTDSGSDDYTISLDRNTPSSSTGASNSYSTTSAAGADNRYSATSATGTGAGNRYSTTSAPNSITTPNVLSNPALSGVPTLPPAPSPPSCTISPSEGNILTPFTINCTSSTCPETVCKYCFRPSKDISLQCGNKKVVQSVFLPLGDKQRNYMLSIVVSVWDRMQQSSSSHVTVVVKDATTDSDVKKLKDMLTEQVSSLEQQGVLSESMLAQIYQSVTSELNKETDVQEKKSRMELREEMLNNLTTSFSGISNKTAQEIQVMAEALNGLTEHSDELTPSSQFQASLLLESLSLSLLSLNITDSNDTAQVETNAQLIVMAASSVLEASESSHTQNQISDNVIHSLDNVQSALLSEKQLDREPTILVTPQIGLYVNRMSADKIQGHFIGVQNSSSASFTFPAASILPKGDTVDLRMMCLGVNPYSVGEGDLISGMVGGLSLTRKNGSAIPVFNLTQEIEIFLPRPGAGEVNSTVLDLGNSSTIIVNMTMTNISLVLKLEPSEDIPLQLLLYPYPNDTHCLAETWLPHPGSTREEKYTWVINPDDTVLEETAYSVMVKQVPQVGASITNATNVTVSVTSIAAQCVYWDEEKRNWSTHGCRVGPLTTPLATQCLCTHLTFFGSSFFVMPNLVDVSRTAELFATFSDNPVVGSFVAAIFGLYLLIVVWARRKDIQDAVKVKVTVLEDNDPLAQYRYMLTVCTGHRRAASPSAQVTVTILGSEGDSEPHHLSDPDKPVFERGSVDTFLLTTPFSLGELQGIRLWHDNSGGHPAWYVNKVVVHDLETDRKWHFLCNSWLAIDVGECVLDKVFPVATEADLKRFSNLFFMKTAKDFRDGHIWYSVISRPPHSNFTRVQRVSCCFSLLLCTMLTSLMFWGVPKDPSEQKMDLGHIEFTWQQVMIGVQSSIIMFPINLFIVSIFRNTRPREKQPERPGKKTKADPAKQGKTGRVSPSQPPSPRRVCQDITPDSVIKDIKRIAQSLSKVMKSPVPQLDRDFGRTNDINKLLSLVEEIIRLHNTTGGEFYTENRKKEGSLVLTLGAVNLQENSPTGSPERTVSSGQKPSDYSHYLYRQLQHVEKELELLGSARFTPPQSYDQAVGQVQGMKELLERHFSASAKSSRLSPSPVPTDGSTRKKCCPNTLPWWFVFVGWLLVVATSGISAYFTIMYGLTYGKGRSINWLISMTVSFFESLFITQPLKVLGFAAFFALVLKKVDHEEESEVAIEGDLTSSGEPGAVLSSRRDSSCSFYQPPPRTDIEKMRNNILKEQKVFILIREIVAYVGFLWVLLLVAYGQRDPNAYLLTQHIEESFTNGMSNTMAHKDVFTWINTTVLSNLFGKFPGFITDGNSKLVGNARVRQVRVRRDSCTISQSVRNSIPDCHSPYSWELEDMASYGPGWNMSVQTSASQVPHAWQYQSQGSLRAHPVWGSMALYRGGGYVAELGPDLQNATSVLQYLFDNTWLDVYTRAVFVEFTVYNANVNLFCIVTLILETTAVGAFQHRTELKNVRLYQSTGGLHVFVMASEVIYFLFILHYMFIQGKRMKEQKWAYFQSKWNLLELAIILLSWSALSVFIKRTLLGNRDMQYYQDHRDEFASFYETAAADAVLGYLIAFLVLLATVKLWHLLRLNPKLHMITSTLQRAWTDISGFIIVIVIMLLSYTIATNLMFGWKLYSYRTLLEAAQTMVSLQLGIFNYEEVLDYNPVLAAFLIGSCIVFMTFVVLNLFISVILVAFSEEQKNHKPSEEEEIVDLMLTKICSFFGIKCKIEKEENCPKKLA